MSASLDFEEWLKETLIKLKADDEVFSPYIISILDTEDAIDEKTESLQGILSGITEDGIDELCSDILSKWGSGKISAPAAEEIKKEPEALDCQLSKLMEQQATCHTITSIKTKINKEQQELKKQILSQYAEVSGDETDPDEGSSNTVSKNTNSATVEEEVRLKREQNKEEHRIKKQKDKEEREKQKAKADERKEKEKKRTQKGERRR